MYIERIKRMIDEVEDIENHIAAGVAPLNDDASAAIHDAMYLIYSTLDELIDKLEDMQ